MFRLDAIAEVGGFTPGHLTEDLDLTNRFWLNGWKGIYLGEVVNYGEVPFTYDHYRRQQERWAAGSARSLREFILPILKTKNLGIIEKLSAIRQNAYFTTTLLTCAAIILGMLTVFWIALFWNSYPVEYYLYIIGLIKTPLIILLYGCILSNFFEPLIMVLFKKRNIKDLLRLPMVVWLAWSVLPTYAIGNLKGLFNINLDWFRTPKFIRNTSCKLSGTPLAVKMISICICFSLGIFYFSQGWLFGWFDEFALLLLPAFILASFN